MLAFSIMFFSGALLCFLLGWADGVRHDKTFLHIPETGELPRRGRHFSRARRLSSSSGRAPRSVADHIAGWLPCGIGAEYLLLRADAANDTLRASDGANSELTPGDRSETRLEQRRAAKTRSCDGVSRYQRAAR